MPSCRHLPHTDNASDRRAEEATPADHPTIGEMLSELVDLSAGLGIVLLVLFIAAMVFREVSEPQHRRG